MDMLEAGQEADFYSILGIERDAGIGVVRQAYRRLMQRGRNHPDLGGSTQKAALINKAYAVLSNPDLRSEYDSRLFILERVAEGFTADSPQATGTTAPLEPARACAFCGEPHDYSPHDDLSDYGCERCGSALQAAGSERLESLGQRAVQRIGRSLNMTLFTRYPQQKGTAATTEDVSLQGLRLVTRCSLRHGQRVRLISNVFDAVGEVVHCAVAPSRWRTETVAGVAFLTLRFNKPQGVFVSRQI